jgi:hypothetical protein
VVDYIASQQASNSLLLYIEKIMSRPIMWFEHNSVTEYLARCYAKNAESEEIWWALITSRISRSSLLPLSSCCQDVLVTALTIPLSILRILSLQRNISELRSKLISGKASLFSRVDL